MNELSKLTMSEQNVQDKNAGLELTLHGQQELGKQSGSDDLLQSGQQTVPGCTVSNTSDLQGLAGSPLEMLLKNQNSVSINILCTQVLLCLLFVRQELSQIRHRLFCAS